MKRGILVFLLVAGVALAANVQITTLSGGKFGTLMNSRADMNKYMSGARTLQNMIVRPQGPVSRRPGTRYIATTKNSGVARLIPFQNSVTDAYVIEMGHQYMRFYRNGAQILDPNDDVYEITTVYDGNDLFDIQYAQTANILRFVHPDYAPRKLERYAHADWRFNNVVDDTGPFLAENTDRSLTITPSGTGTTQNYDYYIEGHDSQWYITGDTWLAQTFTASQGYDAAGVRLALWGDGTCDTLTVGLYATSAGKPTGNALASGTLDVSGVQTVPWGAWYDIDFSVAYTLVQDTVYAIVCSHNSQAGNLYWRMDITNGSYTGGSYAGSSDAGVSWTLDPAIDFAFEVLADGVDDGSMEITLTASDNLFDANHVGSIWEIKHNDGGERVTYRSTAAGSSSNITVQKGRSYTFVTHGTWSGTAKLQRSYDSGTTWEDVGDAYVDSEYDDNIQYTGIEEADDALYKVVVTRDATDNVMEATLATTSFLVTGIVQINAYNSATDVNATVLKVIDSNEATWHWSEGAWSGYRGWPHTVVHHEERILYGGSDSYPQTIWSSRIAEDEDDYDDFTDGVKANDAFTYVLPGLNPIEWMISQSNLMIGTSGGVGRLSSGSSTLTPTNADYKAQNSVGSDSIQAVAAGSEVLFIERGGQKVRQLKYAYEGDVFITPDLTALCDDILGTGVVEIAFQNRPIPMLWCVRDDGWLATMVYAPEHEVIAWSEHVTGE